MALHRIVVPVEILVATPEEAPDRARATAETFVHEGLARGYRDTPALRRSGRTPFGLRHRPPRPVIAGFFLDGTVPAPDPVDWTQPMLAAIAHHASARAGMTVVHTAGRWQASDCPLWYALPIAAWREAIAALPPTVDSAHNDGPTLRAVADFAARFPDRLVGIEGNVYAPDLPDHLLAMRDRIAPSDLAYWRGRHVWQEEVTVTALYVRPDAERHLPRAFRRHVSERSYEEDPRFGGTYLRLWWD